MRAALYTSILFIFILSYSCNSNAPDQEFPQTSPTGISYNLSKGFNMAESYCFSCHSPNATIDHRAAPPMASIKKYYLEEGTSEVEFTEAILKFLKNPSAENSKIPGAVEKYGLMPKMNFGDEMQSQIIHYIYNTKLEQPDWFEENYQNEKNKHQEQSKTEDLSYTEQGMKYAMATKGILGKNLITAINEKGSAEALSFCNTKAIHLTDSMANAQGVKIKRVSDQERNPNNKANAEELAYITATKAKIKEGGTPSPQVVELADKVLGYYPILTNTMCLQCHGAKDKDINAETLAKLTSLYPKDKAIGYGEDELRGIWVIEMPK